MQVSYAPSLAMSCSVMVNYEETIKECDAVPEGVVPAMSSVLSQPQPGLSMRQLHLGRMRKFDTPTSSWRALTCISVSQISKARRYHRTVRPYVVERLIKLAQCGGAVNIVRIETAHLD